MKKIRPIHTRTITVHTFETGGDALLVEGTLTDHRLARYRVWATGEEADPGVIHGLFIAMTVAVPSLEIRKVRTKTSVVPMAECREAADALSGLEGLCLRPGFTEQARRLLGRSRGCLHLLHLVLAMASAALQGFWTYYSEQGGAQGPRPLPDEVDPLALVRDTCWVWRADGPLVSRMESRQRRAREDAGEAEKTAGKRLLIAIDGPAGSGKSTVGREVARRLGYSYLDTGALYRAVAWGLQARGVAPGNEAAVSAAVPMLEVSLEPTPGGVRVGIGGEDVTDRIRSEDVGLFASRIAAYPAVRASLLALQRRAGEAGGIVAEGRDMGSVVFPEADLKFYLDASVAERSRRRLKELALTGEAPSLDQIRESIARRDRQDRNRAVAPLRVPEGAVVIDSTGLSVTEVVALILGKVEKQGLPAS